MYYLGKSSATFIFTTIDYFSYFLFSRFRHAKGGEIREPSAHAIALVVVRAIHQRDKSGQTVGGELYQERPVIF